MTAKLVFVVLLSFAPLMGFAQPRIFVALHENTSLEQKGRAQLERLLETYELDKWIFTDKVLIQSYVTPHSHPVLTLNTRYLDDDHEQLATFLHEQIHWFADEDSLKTEKIINTFKEMYPDVPVGNRQGARDSYSTYLHLMVCWLEFDAVSQLLGTEKARAILAKKSYYQWIYARVLEDGNQLAKVIRKNKMVID